MSLLTRADSTTHLMSISTQPHHMNLHSHLQIKLVMSCCSFLSKLGSMVIEKDSPFFLDLQQSFLSRTLRLKALQRSRYHVQQMKVQQVSKAGLPCCAKCTAWCGR